MQDTVYTLDFADQTVYTVPWKCFHCYDDGAKRRSQSAFVGFLRLTKAPRHRARGGADIK